MLIEIYANRINHECTPNTKAIFYLQSRCMFLQELFAVIFVLFSSTF